MRIVGQNPIQQHTRFVRPPLKKTSLGHGELDFRPLRVRPLQNPQMRLRRFGVAVAQIKRRQADSHFRAAGRQLQGAFVVPGRRLLPLQPLFDPAAPVEGAGVVREVRQAAVQKSLGREEAHQLHVAVRQRLQNLSLMDLIVFGHIDEAVLHPFHVAALGAEEEHFQLRSRRRTVLDSSALRQLGFRLRIGAGVAGDPRGQKMNVVAPGPNRQAKREMLGGVRHAVVV